MSKRKFPRRCECGGKMVYTRDFGMVFSYCLSCTPVETIRIDDLETRVASQKELRR